MSLSLLNGIEQYLTQSFGSIYILAIGILLLLTIGFIMAGIDFRLVLLSDTILIIGFSRMGWIPQYIEGIFWVLVVGLGIYMLWMTLFNR